MRRLVLFAAAALTALGGISGQASAVNLALVLLNDVSNSVDELEYGLMKDGYRAAFSDPDVVASIIGNSGGVAVAYVEFSDADKIDLVLGWSVLTDETSARAFGEAVALAPRSSAGSTSMTSGLLAAADLLKTSDYTSSRMVIDVASDFHGEGARVARVRDQIVADGITINALPLLDDRQIGTFDGRHAYSAATNWTRIPIAEFYALNIIGGEGSFVVEAKDIGVFGEALKRKLLLEFIATGDGVLPWSLRDAESATLSDDAPRVLR
ncbi:MAG: DUF1194 domain-containing protein [Alphaproteobacteria bacterium]